MIRSGVIPKGFESTQDYSFRAFGKETYIEMYDKMGLFLLNSNFFENFTKRFT